MATTTTAAADKPWYESLLSGLGEIGGEALAIKTAGYLNDLKREEGLTQYPQAGNQTPARVDNTGRNLTGFDSLNGNTLMMIGGGLLIVIALLVFVLGGRK